MRIPRIADYSIVRGGLNLLHFEDNSEVAKRNAEVSFILFALAGLVGLISLPGTIPFGKGFEMYALATNLAQNGAFANPFLVLQTGPSAVSPPLYPVFLALLMKLLRAPAFVLLAAALGNVFANAVTAALLPRVSWLFFDSVLPGIVASFLWLMSMQLMPSWEASCVLATLLFFCLFTATSARKGKILRNGAAAGLLAGVLLLFNPVTSLILACWAIFLLVVKKEALKQTAIYICIALIVAAALFLPWPLRNQRQLGGFVARTSLGLTMYSANNDCARTSQVEEQRSGCYEMYHPNYNLSEAQMLLEMGELNYDRERLAEANGWIRTHPEQFRRLTFARIREFWFPRRVEHPFKAAVIWAATILSIPGIVLMARRREGVTLFLLSVLLVYPLMYYVVFSDVRFRYPILWLTLLPAGYFVHWLAQWADAKLQFKLSFGGGPRRQSAVSS
jgi:hypothetical protein